MPEMSISPILFDISSIENGMLKSSSNKNEWFEASLESFFKISFMFLITSFDKLCVPYDLFTLQCRAETESASEEYVKTPLLSSSNTFVVNVDISSDPVKLQIWYLLIVLPYNVELKVIRYHKFQLPKLHENSF